ncbi:hypothetical protein V1477_016222 [Vespula maculifrons]|uniref:Uncharacterized protein n=1 Tax=Vespula maculifrons TaxID=7453 RepID=A0ABD2BCE6_VESMC
MRSGDSRLRTTTTKSGLETTFIVSGSVVLWTSTSELRKYRGSHSLKCRVGILAFKRRQQNGVLDRPLQLLVQLCFGLRRENLEIFADAIHASITEQDTRLRETTTKSGLRPTFTVTSSVVLWTSTREFRNFRRIQFKRVLTKSRGKSGLRNFRTAKDFDNLSSEVDLEIFALSRTLTIYLQDWT